MTMKSLRILLVLGLVIGGLGLSACDDDDDNGGTNPNPTPEEDPWVGEWFMEDDNVPTILTDFLNIKNVRVTLRDDNTITTVETDSTDNVTTREGTYTVGATATNGIRDFTTNYNDGLSQVGIMEVVEGTPDILKLELVPEGGTTPPATPAGGFGTTAPNDGNVQRYELQ